MDENKDYFHEFFGEPISIYTREQAIEDGVLMNCGAFNGRSVVLTANLIASLDKHELVSAFAEGLRKGLALEEPDLVSFMIGETKVWVDFVGNDLTIMLPEDY
jgi:hypothetical protein